MAKGSFQCLIMETKIELSVNDYHLFTQQKAV